MGFVEIGWRQVANVMSSPFAEQKWSTERTGIVAIPTDTDLISPARASRDSRFLQRSTMQAGISLFETTEDSTIRYTAAMAMPQAYGIDFHI